MTIPFVKAHGARNDFLLTWADEVSTTQFSSAAIALCDRNTGVGADGWILVDRAKPAIRLLNSDGSDAEISGNGTRCAAALLVEAGLAEKTVCLQTGAGPKRLQLVAHRGKTFVFEMDMGQPEVQEDVEIDGFPCLILWVGNPQCAIVTDTIPETWVEIGRKLESHPRFPNRTNVSFVRAVDRHTVDARFYERGAGWTKSSGTGSTGAAFAAIHRGLVEPPVTVITEAGPLEIRSQGTFWLTGPAEITARGEFFWNE